MPRAKPMLGATWTHEMVARSVCMSTRIFSSDATSTVVGNEVAATPTINVTVMRVSRRPSTVPPEVTDLCLTANDRGGPRAQRDVTDDSGAAVGGGASRHR